MKSENQCQIDFFDRQDEIIEYLSSGLRCSGIE